MASITFTDGIGTATITQADDGMPTSRFNNWRPNPMPIGEAAHGLGDGFLYRFKHRSDYRASFEMPRIKATDEDIVQRFKMHAEEGGVFTVTTDDSESNEYTECQRAPDSEIEFELSDVELLEYTLRLTVLNVATSPVPLRCVY